MIKRIGIQGVKEPNDPAYDMTVVNKNLYDSFFGVIAVIELPELYYIKCSILRRGLLDQAAKL